jgi:hypothetical protein
MMNVEEAVRIVRGADEGIAFFLRCYILDQGVGGQIIEQIARTLYGQRVLTDGVVSDKATGSPQDLFQTWTKDVIKVLGFLEVRIEYTLERVIEGAASLEALVRYARMVSPMVLPPQYIPTDEVVEGALLLFHAAKRGVEFDLTVTPTPELPAGEADGEEDLTLEITENAG